MNLSVAVIGGGAAGFFVAANIAKSDIAIFETSNEALSKVLISGGGRCNVTHNCLDNNLLCSSYPRGYRELKSAFARFSVADTINWFESRDVPLKTEADGRMFPKSNTSQTIADTLTTAALTSGTTLYLSCGVKKIEQSNSPLGFYLFTKDGQKHFAKILVLATGGSKKGFELAKSLGHTIVSPVPSLFTFEIRDTRLEGRSGVSFNKVSLKLPGILKKEVTGPLLITHWGLSGPAVIKLSAFAAKELFENNYQCPLLVNFLPDLSLEKIQAQLLSNKLTQSKKEVLNYVCFELPKSYWLAACNYVGIVEKQPWAETSDKQLRLLSEILTQAKFNIQGKGKFKEEFVICGGVSLKEVDFKTMQSKICPNLYLTGEILDIDGITGGFNFQSAWTTAWIAAKSINLNKS